MFFKFLKQYVSYSHLTSHEENGILVMLWMALIAAMLLEWYHQETGIDRGWRSVKLWFGEQLRQWTRQLLMAQRKRVVGTRTIVLAKALRGA